MSPIRALVSWCRRHSATLGALTLPFGAALWFDGGFWMSSVGAAVVGIGSGALAAGFDRNGSRDGDGHAPWFHQAPRSVDGLNETWVIWEDRSRTRRASLLLTVGVLFAMWAPAIAWLYFFIDSALRAGVSLVLAVTGVSLAVCGHYVRPAVVRWRWIRIEPGRISWGESRTPFTTEGGDGLSGGFARNAVVEDALALGGLCAVESAGNHLLLDFDAGSRVRRTLEVPGEYIDPIEAWIAAHLGGAGTEVSAPDLQRIRRLVERDAR